MAVPVGNQATVDEIRQVYRLQGADAANPPFPIPVVDVNPRGSRNTETLGRTASTTTAAGNTTLLTVDTKVPTYATGAVISMTKDATCDVASGVWGIYYTPDGESGSQTMFEITRLTTTAQDVQAQITFKDPIKLKPGSTVSCSAFSFTAGTVSRACAFYGFTTDT